MPKFSREWIQKLKQMPIRKAIRIAIQRRLQKSFLGSLIADSSLLATATPDTMAPPSLLAAAPLTSSSANFYNDMKIRVINLNRRSDRWEAFQQQASKLHLQTYSRFSAIDGKTLVMNDPLKKLFHIPEDFQGKRWRNLTHGYCKGAIGCALSHMCLWEELVRSNDEAYIVLEDDVLLVPDFEKRWNELYMGHLKNDAAWDFLYFGINDDTPATQKKHGDKPIYKGIMQFAPVMRPEGGGTFAYCMRKKERRSYLQSPTKRVSSNRSTSSTLFASTARTPTLPQL